jgi:hypothetical protein
MSLKSAKTCPAWISNILGMITKILFWSLTHFSVPACFPCIVHTLLVHPRWQVSPVVTIPPGEFASLRDTSDGNHRTNTIHQLQPTIGVCCRVVQGSTQIITQWQFGPILVAGTIQIWCMCTAPCQWKVNDFVSFSRSFIVVAAPDHFLVAYPLTEIVTDYLSYER